MLLLVWRACFSAPAQRSLNLRRTSAQRLRFDHPLPRFSRLLDDGSTLPLAPPKRRSVAAGEVAVAGAGEGKGEEVDSEVEGV